jgi:hypothetical protein
MNDRSLMHRPLRLIHEFSRPLTDPKWRTKRGFKESMFIWHPIVQALTLRTKVYIDMTVPHVYQKWERIADEDHVYQVTDKWSTYIKLRDERGSVTFFPLYTHYLMHNGKLCLKEMIVFDWQNHRGAGPLPF